MEARTEFSRDEIRQIRQLLEEKAGATREQQKSIRQQIRDLGFFISEVGGPDRGFGSTDLDNLLANSEITSAPPAFWIFQGNPDKWDFRGALEETFEGDNWDWSVRQYGDSMLPGDQVALWVSGRGVP